MPAYAGRTRLTIRSSVKLVRYPDRAAEVFMALSLEDMCIRSTLGMKTLAEIRRQQEEWVGRCATLFIALVEQKATVIHEIAAGRTIAVLTRKNSMQDDAGAVRKKNLFMDIAAKDGFKMENAIKIPVLHHVNLKTTRMPEMIEWYGMVVGSRKQFQNDVMGFITNDEVPGRIALLTSPKLTDDPDRARHTGMHHTAFEYACVDDLLETWVRLKGEGTEPHMALDHGFVLSFYYVDPDGNSVELQADWNSDCAASCAFMETSPVFASNPVGCFVDPAKMVEARKSGMSIEELHRRAYEAGEFEPAARPDMRMAI